MITKTLLTFTGFTNLFLGLFILLHNPKKIINQIYFALAIGLTLWTFGIIAIITGLYSILLGKILFSGGSVLVSAILLFSIFIDKIQERLNKKLLIPTILGIGFGILCLITNYIIVDVRLIDGKIQATYGPLYFLFLFYMILCVFSSIYILFKKFLDSSSALREQLKFIFFGFSLFAMPAIFTNGILPGVFGISKFNQLGPVFSIFLLISFGYAIFQYRLMDIKIIIRQSTIFTLLFTVIVFLFILTTSLLTNILPNFYAMMIPSLIITVGFIPLKNFTEKYIDKFFFRSYYDFREAARDISHTLSKISELDESLKEILKKIINYLNVSKGTIVLFINKNHFISKLTIGDDADGKVTILANSALVKHLTKHPDEILEKDYLLYTLQNDEHKQDEILKLKKEMDELGYALAAPITVKRTVIGILLFGEKNSRDIFSSQDIQLLDIIGRQIGPIIESARLYSQTQQLNKKLIAANEAQSHFIKIVSHQFRTPLSAIRMNAELLNDDLKNNFFNFKDKKESVETILQRTLFLVDILDNIFDALTIDSQEISIQRKPSIIWEFFENTRAELDQKIKERQINFILQKSYSLLCEINADIEKIAKTIKILVTNAVYYNKISGSIEIKMEYKEINGKKFIQCAIEDTGIGIADDDLKKIFNKFYRASNAIKEVPNGLGLGLFIAKNFIELHGGQLWVTSELDKGSTFYFTLPVN